MKATDTIFALFFGPVHDPIPVVNGYDVLSRSRLETFLFDRRANGDAFPGERIRTLSVAQYNRHAQRHNVPEIRIEK